MLQQRTQRHMASQACLNEVRERDSRAIGSHGAPRCLEALANGSKRFLVALLQPSSWALQV